MTLHPDDLTAFGLTLKLAAVSTLILLVVGTPLCCFSSGRTDPSAK